MKGKKAEKEKGNAKTMKKWIPKITIEGLKGRQSLVLSISFVYFDFFSIRGK